LKPTREKRTRPIQVNMWGGKKETGFVPDRKRANGVLRKNPTNNTNPTRVKQSKWVTKIVLSNNPDGRVAEKGVVRS